MRLTKIAGETTNTRSTSVDTTGGHPRGSGGFGVSTSKSLSLSASAMWPRGLELLRLNCEKWGRSGLIPAQPPFSRSALHQRLLSRTPGFRPSVNSKPAASSTCRRLSTVRLRTLSPRSNRTMVSGDTFAAAANFLTLKPIAALAIRHCTGSTFSQPLHAAWSGSAVPQRDDYRRGKSASANQIEDQQTPHTA